ncbi:hypothetical protein [Rubrivirga sp.]|uniref:hypothetical protein n=1 Tax=Rubrivirga sp. TaxID=1885344 RepID=UPI003B52CF55
MFSRLLIAPLLLLAACDSGVESPPLFVALEGTWTATADAEPPTIRFFSDGRYELVADEWVAERGRFSLASDGNAADPDALAALNQIQLYPEDRDLSPTFFDVVSANSSALSLQRCFGDCEGVAVWVYRRQ